MTDQNASGSRWEPTAAGERDAPVEDHLAPAPLEGEDVVVPPAGAEDDHAEDHADAHADAHSDAHSGRGWLTRTRVLATAAAAALFLGGGAAGYAVGHGTQDGNGTVGRFAGPGGDGDHGFGRPDGDGRQGQLPPGGQSGPGTGNGAFSGSADGNPT